MIEEKDFENHINSMPNDCWEKLFEFIPRISSSKDFGAFYFPDSDTKDIAKMPYMEIGDLVREFFGFLEDNKLIIIFDWPDWEEGKSIISNEEYKNQSPIVLFKILTTFIRANRFNEEFLVEKFEDGTIGLILQELKTQMGNNFVK